MFPCRFPKAIVVVFTVILLLCSISGSAFAVPNLISYQGKLVNGSGAPLDGTYNIKFSIYDAANNGTEKWSETQSVAVSGGIYTVLLGSVTGLVPANFTSDQLYLQIQVGSEILTPRQILTTTGFAFRAASADSVTLPDNGIISSGTDTLMHTTGSGNFFAGIASGNLTMSGYNNTANGSYSLYNNTSGNGNTANGSYSLYSNTSGYANTASGYAALENNTVGYYNTATGINSLNSNTIGNNNTANGGNTLASNTEGSENTASGTNALKNNTTGSNNTAKGFDALYNNTIGNQNTALGVGTLNKNTTGNSNTASGFLALNNNTLGINNTANGTEALYKNTIGYENTATGVGALSTNTSGSSNTANGSYALSKNITGNYNSSSGLVALFNNTYGHDNTAKGAGALFSNTTGNSNTAIGSDAGYANISGDSNTFIGATADASTSNLSNTTAIGYGAVVDASNRVRIGNTSVTQIGGQVAWSNLSDSRIKKDITPISYGLDFIAALKPVQYRMRNGNDRLDFGFIAQDVETLIGDNYNLLCIASDADRTLSLRYTDFIAPMVKAMQEQQVIIKHQEESISAMRSELDALKAAIAAIRTARQ